MRTTLRIRQEQLMTAEAVAQADTHYTSSIDFERCNGNATLLIVSTAGSITVTQQCSLDNSTWYDAVNTSGTAVGAVASALTVTTGTYVVYSPVLAPYIRFKVVENNSAPTVVSIKLNFQV